MSESGTLHLHLKLNEAQAAALREAALKGIAVDGPARVDRRRKRITRMSEADLMKQFGVEWIAAEFESAAQTLRHYRSPNMWPTGYRAAWPEFVRSTHESYNSDGARSDLSTRITPSAAEISRLDRALGWLKWLNDRERKIVWAIASGLSKRKVGAMFGKGRTSMHEDHVAALLNVAIHLHSLSRQLGKPTIAKIK